MADKQAKEKPQKPCWVCGSTDWWQRWDGEWVCGLCHPDPKKEEKARLALPSDNFVA